MERKEKQKLVLKFFIFCIVVTALVLGLLKFYLDRDALLTTPENTMLELNAALLTNDVAGLAVFFDFFAIQQTILGEINKQATGGDLEALYLEKMPTRGKTDLLFSKIFMALSMNEAVPVISLDGETTLLPADLGEQMRVSKFELIKATNGEYFVRVLVSLPYMEPEYVIFSFEKFGKRWRLKNIINISRFVTEYNAVVSSLITNAENEIINHNADAKQKMYEYVPNPQCIMEVGYIEQSVPKMKVYVTTEPLNVTNSVSSWGFNAQITDSEGNVLMDKPLRINGFFVSTQIIRKTVEKDIPEEQYEMFKAEPELNCSITHTYVRLQDDTLINYK